MGEAVGEVPAAHLLQEAGQQLKNKRTYESPYLRRRSSPTNKANKISITTSHVLLLL